jgi:hypothetical protein
MHYLLVGPSRRPPRDAVWRQARGTFDMSHWRHEPLATPTDHLAAAAPR